MKFRQIFHIDLGGKGKGFLSNFFGNRQEKPNNSWLAKANASVDIDLSEEFSSEELQSIAEYSKTYRKDMSEYLNGCFKQDVKLLLEGLEVAMNESYDIYDRLIKKIEGVEVDVKVKPRSK